MRKYQVLFSDARTRLRFHLAHKFGDEKKLMTFHQELEDIIEDQLSLASIHYLRSHYQEAIGNFTFFFSHIFSMCTVLMGNGDLFQISTSEFFWTIVNTWL